MPPGPSPSPNSRLSSIPAAEIIGYTIGNDMSSRDIEGTNPLYLPQAKVYDRSCALGPGILIRNEPMPSTTQIKLDILRSGTDNVFRNNHVSRNETRSSDTGRVSLSRPKLSLRMLSADRDRHRPAGLFHACKAATRFGSASKASARWGTQSSSTTLTEFERKQQWM